MAAGEGLEDGTSEQKRGRHAKRPLESGHHAALKSLNSKERKNLSNMNFMMKWTQL